MKLILPPSCKSLSVIEYERNGELVIEVTDRPGNVGKRGEELETLGHIDSGRIFSFTEAKQ